jgi:hypothetical protein
MASINDGGNGGIQAPLTPKTNGRLWGRRLGLLGRGRARSSTASVGWHEARPGWAGAARCKARLGRRARAARCAGRGAGPAGVGAGALGWRRWPGSLGSALERLGAGHLGARTAGTIPSDVGRLGAKGGREREVGGMERERRGRENECRGRRRLPGRQGARLMGPSGPARVRLGFFFFFFSISFSNFEIPIQINIKFIIIKPKLFINKILILRLIFIILFM